MNNRQSFNLIPEEHLLSSLSPLWQGRFRRAIDYLNNTIDRQPAPSWEEVAHHSAISPYHFHRMFRTVFHEPPGQYLRRLRLQTALYYLVNNIDQSVTEVAHRCGFSSSQSMAKALRRELDISAKCLRRQFIESGWDAVEPFLLKLGQPEANSQPVLEQSIARDIEFHVQHSSAISLQVKHYPDSGDWENVVDHGYESGSDIYGLIRVSDINKPEKQQTYLAGKKVNCETQSNFMIPAGDYLCCRVRLNSMVGYFALWDVLYEKAMSLDIEPDPEGYVIELFHYQKEWLDDITDLTIRIAMR
ncbi:hypothetical protein GZ77_23435 [Endozoicomonas montiporae]|uniref:HTH araC/xylS-type domain-containing protein n=2 Tax=Endozoicomonas montiporae TaxID=1027273 RepID=A0A081N0R4_9GAMM|nr:helix-turn-helix transcriptional regulator [Endozoicomonas montiporae]AMO54518.1 hypothetical protein EZMO1_0253 [Endozoicomonas montiporae CL-33]KEQ12037.1 hypothetical protein GZ77_23435 [Endozoicomonas montiporae]